MKLRHIAIILTLFVSSITGRSQDTLKAQSKAISAELNVNPFQGSLSFNNSLQQIKVRYFKTDDFALRIGFNGTYQQFDNNNNQYGGGPDSKDSRRTGTLGLNFGFENHFKGTRRLSPYVGAELSLALKYSKEVITNTNNFRREITGGWINDNASANGYSVPYNEFSYTRFGVNVVSGFDYYPAKNFYFGYEFFFQIYGKNNADVKDVIIGSGPNGTMKGSNEFFIGPNLINGIRLGYIF